LVVVVVVVVVVALQVHRLREVLRGSIEQPLRSVQASQGLVEEYPGHQLLHRITEHPLKHCQSTADRTQ
jgi:hypothetical protein